MYNAISRKDEAIVVRVPVNSEKIIVMDAMATNIACQVILHHVMLHDLTGALFSRLYQFHLLHQL